MLAARRNTDHDHRHTSTYLYGSQETHYTHGVAAVEAWLRFGCGRCGDARTFLEEGKAR